MCAIAKIVMEAAYKLVPCENMCAVAEFVMEAVHKKR